MKVGDLIPIGGSGNVKKTEVLTGKTYSSDEGVDLVGSMPNRGTLNRTLTKEGDTVNLSAGYYSGGSIKTQITNLTASNIKKGVTVGGIAGTYSPNINIFVEKSYNLKYEFSLKGPGTIYFRLSSFSEFNFDVIIDKSGDYSFRNIGHQAKEFYTNSEYFQINGYTISGDIHMSGSVSIVGLY